MLLNLEIKNVLEWKALIDAIESLTDEATFLCNDEGITFRGIDKAQVSYLSITFPLSSFLNYEFESTFFVIYTEDFKNLLNTADANSTIQIKITNQEHALIVIKGNYEVEFKLKLIAKEYGTLTIPRINSQSQIVLSTPLLRNIFDDIKKVTEYVQIDCFTDKIQFSGKGDIGSAKIELSNNELIKLDTQTECSSTYSLEYIMNILDTVGKTCDELNLEYGSMIPLHLHFELPSNIIIDYYLSPRI